MIGKIAQKIFGSRNTRVLSQYQKLVKKINELEDQTQSLSDEALAAKTQEFKQRLASGTKIDDLIPEAFAVVREAGQRVLSMRHFDMQLVGGLVLHYGNIAEMRTGEGKTLVATLPVYLNALEDKGVHVVTVNDYLAKRDAEWMGKLYNFLGMSVGIVVGDMKYQERKEAYAADITYGTNNEFGFDYLRDNMKFSAENLAQRGRHFAVVDEVDSILIDEARTPLIISGPTDNNSELYIKVDKIVPHLIKQESEDSDGDYLVEEKSKQVFLSEQGHQHIEDLMTEAGLIDPEDSLYDVANIGLLHHVNASLRARVLFQKNVDYIVRNDEIIIVDEFTGRTMPGRRWSEGLHQAVEAKEGVTIQNENQTLASITFQNYFRLYDKLSGMTGTADTEAFEFQQIYNLEVVVVPTHKPMVRDDRGDLVYLTLQEKFQAIIEDLKDCVQRKQPALVGTASIESSELLSKLLTEAKIEHQVLNAKHHATESQIIVQAGRPGAVTIATNMAGRGTDIVLGGNVEAEIIALGEDADQAHVAQLRRQWVQDHKQVLDAGGLHIIGTERHESRRIDNQLRGRAGRQGDAGSTRFYLSLEDNLMRIFASDKVRSLMQKLGMEEGEAIEHPWVSKAIENAQRKVESHNFDIRKQLLEYDDVANDQRKVIYQQRNELMVSDDISENIEAIRLDVMTNIIDAYVPPNSMSEQWDVDGLVLAIQKEFGLALPIKDWLDREESLYEEPLRERIHASLKNVFDEKEQFLGSEMMRKLEKDIMLQALDAKWKEHLAAMDYLRQSVGLRGYAQKNPKQEYKREAFEMFQQMLEEIKQDTVSFIAHVKFKSPEEVAPILPEDPVSEEPKIQLQHADAADVLHPTSTPAPKPAAAKPRAAARPSMPPIVRSGQKIGRNEPCHCGSGKKFKQCHGKLT